MSETKTITIKRRLKTDTIKLGKKARGLLGKNVEIVIREIAQPKPVEKKWQYLGSVSLGEETDAINIRDFAHND